MNSLVSMSGCSSYTLAENEHGNEKFLMIINDCQLIASTLVLHEDKCQIITTRLKTITALIHQEVANLYRNML